MCVCHRARQPFAFAVPVERQLAKLWATLAGRGLIAVAGSSRRLLLSNRSAINAEGTFFYRYQCDPLTHADKVQTRMPSIPGMSVVSKMSAELQRRPFVEHAHPPSDRHQATGTKRPAPSDRHQATGG